MQQSHVNDTTEGQRSLVKTFEHITFLLNNHALDEATAHLLTLHYADIADFLDNTNHKLYPTILILIPDDTLSEVIVSLSDSSKQIVLEALDIIRASKLINRMDIEDAIDVFDNLDEEYKELLLEKVDSKVKLQILEGFSYPKNKVGRIVEKNFLALQKDWNVGQAIEHIRNSKTQHAFHAAIIVDSYFKPSGTLLLSTLLKHAADIPISTLTHADFRVMGTFTDIDDLVFVFKQYGLTVVPVVNKNGKLIGTVSINNMLYILQERTENEFLQLEGIGAFDMFKNIIWVSKDRFPWICINLITACMTSIVINEFSSTINRLIILAVMMPTVTSISGSVGGQVMTVTVRAIANREINYANKRKIIMREIAITTINGGLIACIGAIVTNLLFRHFEISAIFAISTFLNFAIAGLIGCAIPITLHSIDIDPATASAVLVSALMDAIAVFIFLGLATILLT